MLMVSRHPSSLSLLKFKNKKGWNPFRIPAFFSFRRVMDYMRKRKLAPM